MILTLLLPLLAFATTFGPISVVGQVTNASYIVHGRVVGSSWVAEERESRRPYTYWKLQVIEQPKGENLGGEVIMREPGGEIGGLGYHVAGSAQFREGEETFVTLKDTSETGVKEVVGLASGKYTVERSEKGEDVLRSGLGFLMQNEKGEPYNPETFTALIKRIVSGEETEGDRSVFINKQMAHEHDPELEKRTEEALALQPKAAPPSNSSEKTELSPPVAVQESPTRTEEPESSWMLAWWIGGFGLLAGAVYLLKR